MPPRTIVAMSYTDHLLGTIDARIAEAHEQMASLESALEALQVEAANGAVAAANGASEVNGTPAAPVRDRVPAARANGSARRASGSRARNARKLDADGLTAILEGEAEGLSAVTIAERSGASYNQVLELLRERERAGDIRRSGTRRTSLWRVITDEERIAERAAELAAR